MARIGRAIVRVPKRISKGQVFKIQMVITHPMETGRRKDKKTGQPIPAHYIDLVEFFFNDQKVTTLHTGPAISKNPYFAVKMKASESGTLVIRYRDNKGGKWEKSVKVSVS